MNEQKQDINPEIKIEKFQELPRDVKKQIIYWACCDEVNEETKEKEYPNAKADKTIKITKRTYNPNHKNLLNYVLVNKEWQKLVIEVIVETQELYAADAKYCYNIAKKINIMNSDLDQQRTPLLFLIRYGDWSTLTVTQKGYLTNDANLSLFVEKVVTALPKFGHQDPLFFYNTANNIYDQKLQNKDFDKNLAIYYWFFIRYGNLSKLSRKQIDDIKKFIANHSQETIEKYAEIKKIIEPILELLIKLDDLKKSQDNKNKKSIGELPANINGLNLSSLELTKSPIENTAIIDCVLPLAPEPYATLYKKVKFIDCTLSSVQLNQCELSTCNIALNSADSSSFNSQFFNCKIRIIRAKDFSKNVIEGSQIDLSQALLNYKIFKNNPMTGGKLILPRDEYCGDLLIALRLRNFNFSDVCVMLPNSETKPASLIYLLHEIRNTDKKDLHELVKNVENNEIEFINLIPSDTKDIGVFYETIITPCLKRINALSELKRCDCSGCRGDLQNHRWINIHINGNIVWKRDIKNLKEDIVLWTFLSVIKFINQPNLPYEKKILFLEQAYELNIFKSNAAKTWQNLFASGPAKTKRAEHHASSGNELVPIQSGSQALSIQHSTFYGSFKSKVQSKITEKTETDYQKMFKEMIQKSKRNRAAEILEKWKLAENAGWDEIQKQYQKLKITYYTDSRLFSKTSEDDFEQLQNEYVFLTEYFEFRNINSAKTQQLVYVELKELERPKK